MKEKIEIGSPFYVVFQNVKQHKWQLISGKIKSFIDHGSPFFMSENGIEYNLKDANVFTDQRKAHRYILNKNNKITQNLDDISNGFHTFRELYDQQVALLSVISALIPAYCVKSKQSHDGNMSKGMFTMRINYPNIKPITFHLKNEYWDKIPCAESDQLRECEMLHATNNLKRLEELSHILFKNRTTTSIRVTTHKQQLPLNDFKINQR